MIYLILSIIFMVLLALVTRMSTAASCNAISFNAIARYFSGTIMLIFTLCVVDWQDILPAFKAVGWMGATGAFYFAYQQSAQQNQCSMAHWELAGLFYDVRWSFPL